MKSLRTPDARFDNLPGYDFAPHYVDVDDTDGGTLRVHTLDEGPRAGAVVLLMHGEPSWCYLYRKMVAPLVAAGHRVVAPDQVGFGRSDKPTEVGDYSYARHLAWMTSVVHQFDLRDITLVCQDWGGLIGLRMVSADPDRFARLVIANTGLPTGDPAPPEAFKKWRAFSQSVPEFPVGSIIQGATTTELPPEVVAAYDAPFPDETYKAGARSFPILVPIDVDDPEGRNNVEAWKVLERFDRPVLTAFSDEDPITGGGHRAFQQRVPGARGQPHTIIHNGGHFLQEDQGEILARVVVDFIAST